MSALLRRTWIRLFNWEYWPFHIVYFPSYFYWSWLSLKARSFFFFSEANPGIKNSGFLMEPKHEIYDILPVGLYPKTIFCKKGTQPEVAISLLSKAGLQYPVILKPDIGQRGLGVELVHGSQQLVDYVRQSNVDFLIQEYADLPMEAGIFYYRIPGEERGHVSGIVGKELLSVTGDGHSTIGILLEKDDRAFLQMKTLHRTYGKKLQEILPAGKQLQLVPYGNHSRGARFIDMTVMADVELTERIDVICKQVPGFYFGRLDIKFSSWEELRRGEKISIIELNGAGSEPTHMYDPGHSLLFAWKEIMRHHRILYRISLANARMSKRPLMKASEGLSLFSQNAKHVQKLTAVVK